MKDHAEASIGDNANKKFKEYNDVVAQIKTSVHTAAEHHNSRNDATDAALGQTLDLGYLFAQMNDEWALLKEFLQFHQKPWTAENDGNFFHGIVTVAFDVIDPKTGELPDREDHRRPLGNLTTEEPDTLPEGLRFFDFHMVRTLIKFANDYDRQNRYRGVGLSAFCVPLGHLGAHLNPQSRFFVEDV